MKIFALLIIIPFCFVGCEEEFGQRIIRNATKANTANNDSKDKESLKSKKKDRDLDTHESLQTYEYALAPIEVQTHYPKVIAEEHTIHELPAHSLPPHLTANEPIILTDSSHNYGSATKSLYGAQRMPRLLGSVAPRLPIYKDDPKEQLRRYLPGPLKPALPMHEFNQVSPDTSDEITYHAPPISVASRSLSAPPYARAPVKHSGLTGYSANFNEHLEPSLGSYVVDRVEPLVFGRSDSRPHHSYDSYPYIDHIPGIPGKPWKDYPVFHSIPNTHFKCRPHNPGYFADVEAGCQVWHYCQLDGRHDRFLCSNGTLFNQKTRVCDWWHNVDCHSSVLKYGINADLYREPTHKKYLPPSNPINKYQTHYNQPVPLQYGPIPVPLGYHHSNADFEHSGHGLVFAESQVVPHKKGIRRVRKVRLNKGNATESESLPKNNRSVQSM